MVSRHAVIIAGTVENVCLGPPGWQARVGTTVELPAGSRVGPGWAYDGAQFTPPPAPAPDLGLPVRVLLRMTPPRREASLQVANPRALPGQTVTTRAAPGPGRDPDEIAMDAPLTSGYVPEPGVVALRFLTVEGAVEGDWVIDYTLTG